jgi:long-chain fatty acid transport protein
MKMGVKPTRNHCMSAKVALAVALLGAAATASAGGLLLYEIGTDDVGLASAGYSARAQDASTVLTNPAGMSRLEGTQTLLGAQLLYGDLSLSEDHDPNRPEFQASGGDGGNPIGWFPAGSAFITHRVSDDVTLGMGMAGNFGLSVDYDKNWAGRYYGQEATLMGISLLPSASFKVNDKLSLGAGVNAMYGIMEMKTAVNNVLPAFSDGRMKYKDETWGIGGNLGLMYEFSPATRFGLTYNSQVNLNFEGRVKFSGIAPHLNTVLNNRGLQNAKTKIDINVPQGVMASLFTQVNSDWALLGSLGWQDWSKFGMVEMSIDSSAPKSTTANLDFKDTWHAALGAQYRFKPDWLLNFGMSYDSAFQKSSEVVTPILPTNEGWRFGVGVDNQVNKSFSWGVAGEYIYGGTQDVHKDSKLPVSGPLGVGGGRGDLNGSYNNEQMFFISANAKWAF